MTLYNVHLYREMRLTFEGIEADSPETAAAIVNMRQQQEADAINDCDGKTFAALVDTAGDESYRQSVTIDFEAERQRKAAPKLMAAIESLIAYAEAEALSLERHRDTPEAEEAAHQAWQAIESAREALNRAKEAGLLTTPLAGDATEPVKAAPRFEFTYEPEEADDRAYVLIDGRFDVSILRTPEGLVIDAYFRETIEPMATMTVWDEDAESDAAEGA